MKGAGEMVGETAKMKGSFCFGKLYCRYLLHEDEELIYLVGEEKEGMTELFSETLAFSKEERVFAEGLYSLLLKSRTCPRMMKEVAEDILP